ncbi:YlmH family RNA-binding protein [Desulfofundulus thermocisternus]|uniref:YlmH family RNA-binding protein n=1 Tax=Desulfofundulus thermocisternus TaxID=42471 RepID=UPI00217CF64E|nr:YlmH/Sll1252 family protein [Desulfofundulus thermocisternus]MCS5694703.1 YlmH/Sll1252 family protein [Desulfofundulus thermocisternus]
MLDKEFLLCHARNQEEKEMLARIYDLVQQVLRTRQPRVTDFLDPYHAGLVDMALKRVPDLAAGSDGGYPAAERVRVLIYPDYLEPREEDWQLAYLSLRGSFAEQELSHRDFLGALLSLGLRREKIGDILLHNDRAQLVVAAEVSSFVQSQLTRVGSVPVTVEEISREQICPPPRRVREIKATVPSLRLDVVAAAGFGTSRTRMAREITAQRVSVNWQVCTELSRTVREGDIISARGRGRVQVTRVTGTTRSGRLALILHRYV